MNLAVCKRMLHSLRLADTVPLPGGVVVLYAWLALITLIAALFGSGPFLPLDARSNEPVHGVHLEYPAWASVLEPATALFHIIQTTPDYRCGILSLLLWLLAGVAGYTLFTARRAGMTWSCSGLRALRNGLLATLFYSLYVVCAFTSHFPSWTLKKDVPGIVAADLHSHSLLSHDGIISARENLFLHRQRGYDLVALSDHINPRGPFVAFHDAGKDTAEALPGIEMPVYYGGHFYLTAVGMDRDTPMPGGLAWLKGDVGPVPPPWFPSYLWSVRRFVDTVHQHHGVVDVVALNISSREVHDLADAGVDGFEFINGGRAPLSDDVRHALIEAQQSKGVGLLAASDWHGWSGALALWTLFRDPGYSPGELPADIVMQALRRHDAAHITPVIPFPVHGMGWLETLVSPFVSVFLYAKSLSLEQLLAWWVWIGMLTLLMVSDAARSVCVARFAVRSGLLAAAVLLLADGTMLLRQGMSDAFSGVFVFEVAGSCFALGMLALLTARRVVYTVSVRKPLLQLDIWRFPYVSLVRERV